MAGYSSARKLTNVVGRIDYISNPKRQENIIGFYNTTDNDFWHKLAKESQEQFIRAKTKGKCCEAREFIIGLPQNCDWTAEWIADWFKETFGMECACAIHYKKKENNLHAHLIFSERELLKEPLITEQKTAVRTYYYDEKGKKCKKADAVKVVPKGTILQESTTRYFTDKNEYFKTLHFALKVKELFLNKNLELEKFDKTRMWATKHIGKNNPKGEFISEYNELIGELNNYYKSIEGKYDFGSRTPKEEFCRLYDIKCKSTFSVFLTADIREKFANFKELYPINQKTAENGFESLTEPNTETTTSNSSDYFRDWSDEELEGEHEYWKQALEKAKTDLETAKRLPHYANSRDVVLQDVARINRQELTEKYQDQKGNTLIQKIEYFINVAKYCIRQLLDEIKVRNNVANANLNIDTDKSEPELNKEDNWEIEM